MKRPATVILAVLATAAPASAQEGVTIDPGSPSSKEYAIPLEAARREAAGPAARPDGAAQPGERSAPPFGEGVGPDTATGADAAPATSAPPGAAATAGATSPEDRPEPAGPAAAGRPLAVVRADAADGGWADGAAIAGLAAAVLVLGGVLGSILRRRGTP